MNQPFQINLSDKDTSFTVPTGTRLVIEFISVKAEGGATSDAGPGFFVPRLLIKSPDSQVTTHYFDVTVQKVNTNTNVYLGSQPTRLYAGPETTILFSPNFSSPGGEIKFSASISGRLVDIQPDDVFLERFELDLTGKQTETGNFIVPGSKPLIIECVSALGVVPAGQSMSFLFTVTIKGDSSRAAYFLLESSQPQLAERQDVRLLGSVKLLKMFANPGERLSCTAVRDSSAGDCNAVITVSGYFVDTFANV